MCLGLLTLLTPLAHAADEDEPTEVIVVTGTRTERPLGDAVVATEVIPRETIEASGAEHVGRLLEQHPGLQVQRSFQGASVSMRGLGPEHVLVLVDGQRIAGRVDGAVDLTRIPIDDIAQIEIVKGPASAVYGSDAMGGVINLVTRRASDGPQLDAHVRAGTLGTLDASASGSVRHEGLSNRLTVGWHAIDSYTLDPDTVATDGSAFRTLQLSDRLELKLTPDAWIELRGSYLLRRVHGVDANAGGAVFDRENLTEELQIGGGPRLLPDARTKVQLTGWLTLFRDQFLLDQRGADVLDSYQDTRDLLTQLTLQVDRLVGESHHLVLGAEGAHEGLRSQRLADDTGDRQRAAAFAQDEWTVTDRLTVSPGVRVDVDSWYGAWPSPRLAARLQPTDWLILRGSAGLGYRAPSFKELLLHFENPGVGYVVEGNPALRPERSRGADLSLDLAPAPWLGLTASVHRNDLADLITIGTIGTRAGESARYGYVNVASAFAQGVEAGLTVTPAPSLELGVSYALTDTRDLEADRPLEGRARHQGNASLGWSPGPWGLLARCAVQGARPFYEDRGGSDATVWADPHALLDLRMSWSGTRFGGLFVGVDNLLDAGDPDWTPIPPRLVYAGVDGRLPGRSRRSDTGGPQ